MKPRPWLNYHHLLYFKMIAMEGGIAKAAKKLRLGQPTLSTQMKQFEETLGHSLFSRTKRQLQLTEAGKLVLGYATEIFKLGDEMIDALFDHHSTTKIQVQIGATDTVPKHITMRVLQKAQEAYDCVVSIIEGHGDELLRELLAHRVDIIVCNYPPPVGDAAGFYAKSLGKMQIVVCASPKFSNLKQGFPESLIGQPFIFPTLHSKLRHDIEHYLKLHHIHVVTKAEIQDISLQKLMSVHGDGLIAIPLPAAEELIVHKKLSLIGTLQDVYEELWLVAAQRRIQNPVAAAIMKDFKL